MTSKKFEEEYKKLNPKQKEAVDTIEGPVMVIAGPGTGKTTILTLRIANILKVTDTPPSGILALTFTEAGAKTMRTKLREIIGERALDVPVHTFHGFAASVIAEFGDHFPHLSRSKQITDIEAEMILREILKQKKFGKLRPLGEPDFYLGKILGAISDAKQESWTPEILKSFALEEMVRIKNDPTSVSSRGNTKGSLKGEALKRIEKCEKTILFAEVYEEYEVRKKEERKIDFDDLIFELAQVLRKDKLLLQILQERFLYILIDEHQDTNDSQNLIVKMLADFFESPNLFVVGDEKQAIYRFQGASVENFLQFQKIWGKMKIISLEDNYRSHQKILDASFKMIEQNYESDEHQNLRVKLIANINNKKPLDIISAPNIETEEENLVENLRELTNNEKNKTVAIIVRRNSEVAKILSLLDENDLPASAERGANIFANPVGYLFFSLLEFLKDPSKTEALAETFTGGLWNSNFQKQAEFIKFARSGNLQRIEKEIPQIAKLQKEITNTGAIEYLALVADVSGFTRVAGKDPLSTEIWRVIFELGKDLANANDIEDPRKLIEIMLAYKKTADKKTVKIRIGSVSSQITVMTAHSSKGLEFDYVFLPYAVEECWITKNHSPYFVLPRERESEDDIRDERRLFYVALTRAREHVCISYSAENEAGKMLSPLRFIDELDSAHITKTNLERKETLKINQSIEKRELRMEKEKIEYAKRVLLEDGLSVTALNHFMNCPSEFFYKSILRLPEPPTASAEKGNAMHEALRRVWENNSTFQSSSRQTAGERENTNNNPPFSTIHKREVESKAIQIIIENTVKDYFKKSLLASFEKEIILEELLANAPKVAAALLEHFSQTGNISTESWVESYFKHEYNPSPHSHDLVKENIEIKLHGKMDAIIQREREILVFDYKTRETMSEKEIRGETKNSDGSYFRQLIFYKMLLEENHKYKGKNVEPALVFIKPDNKGRCPTVKIPIEDSDIERVKGEIVSLIDSIWSGFILTSTCSNPACKFCALKKLN